MNSIRQAAFDAVNARVEYGVFKHLIVKNYLIEFLIECNWNLGLTSKLMGIHRNTLTRLMEKHKIEMGDTNAQPTRPNAG